MPQLKRITLVVGLATIGACSSKPPAGPSPQPQPSPTRILELSGNLAFGDVALGSTMDRTLSIKNSGTAALNISGLTGPAGYTASWTSGAIAPGATQTVTMRLSPTEERTYNGTLTVNGDHTSGTNTIGVTGRGVVVGPRTQFGAGQWLVNTDIAAGRYFSVPANGCYWERQSGTGGTFGEIIANDFVGYAPVQYIIDILTSDKAFQTDADCKTWFNTPRTGSQSSIPPGIWLVGSQVTAGTYRASASDGCYWERVKDFKGEFAGIIANHFQSGAASILVTIASGDVGFSTDGQCGTWTRQSATDTDAPIQSTADLEQNWQLKRVRVPRR